MRRPSLSSRMLPPSLTAALAAVLAGLVLVALAGCGGDGDPDATAAAPPATGAAPPAASIASPEPPPPPLPPAGKRAPRDSRQPEESRRAEEGEREPEPDPPASATDAAAARTGQLTVHVTRPTVLHARPGGHAIARLAARTEFRSPRILPVVRRSDGWLGVLTSALPNGRIGWIPAGASLQAHVSDYRIAASLGRREIVVRRAGRVVSRFPVAIGGADSPTPTGRYAVTDKLLTGDASSPYGCCILALSGHQSRTPQGWGGGDRLAIHATNLPETIGTAASLGCLRAPTAAARWLVDAIPLGTIVRIKP